MVQTMIEGAYCRVAEPEWAAPLDPSFAAAEGQRRNPQGMECLYLNRAEATALANVPMCCASSRGWRTGRKTSTR